MLVLQCVYGHLPRPRSLRGSLRVVRGQRCPMGSRSPCFRVEMFPQEDEVWGAQAGRGFGPSPRVVSGRPADFLGRPLLLWLIRVSHEHRAVVPSRAGPGRTVHPREACSPTAPPQDGDPRPSRGPDTHRSQCGVTCPWRHNQIAQFPGKGHS